ncbi:hypothetical protein F4778DRAFT_760806 [Xylariomycetidae sp. FL2044]|nr:hypothetical protein F4778DRAFT_760806 [Xylariomycetidae sp. FL2044]
MASLVISTPSPPGRVHTPDAPKHGFTDSWEPFSPRKSARISSRQSTQRNRTPSPRASHPFHSHISTSSTQSRKQHQQPQSTTTSFATPINSPRKKRVPAMDSVRRASASLNPDGAGNPSASLGTGQKSQPNSATSGSTSQRTGMLPTPAKTPRKEPNPKTEAASRAIARNLFSTPPANADLPKKKKASWVSGFTLESFTAEQAEDPIEIFTDSRDRIPKVDENLENPFLGNRATEPQQPGTRRSKRKQVTIPGEGKQAIDEAVHREDGIVYVFRGKKIFRKFSEGESEDEDEAEAGEDLIDVTNTETRRVTRSSIKPRLLFPSKEKGKGVSNEDEEAVTDIEDHVLSDPQDTCLTLPATPAKRMARTPDTPEAPRFAPASPPTTARTTRTGDKLGADDTPMKRTSKAKRGSPFDDWRVSKSRSHRHGQKRGGEALPEADSTSKRHRA